MRSGKPPASPPPTVSPDGRFYWDGQRWVPLPAAGKTSDGQTAPSTAQASSNSGCGPVALALVVIAIGIVIIVAVESARNSAANCPSGQFCVTVTHWQSGSADVSGTIINATGSGCSDPEITLHLSDHNNAKVRDFTFGAGDLANDATRNWTTHMVGLLYVDLPAEPNVTQITADAVCADQHG